MAGMIKKWITKGTNAKQCMRRDVVEGRLVDFSFNRKFGRTSEIDVSAANFPIDIWEGGSVPAGANGSMYPWDNANAPMYVCSSDGADAGINIGYYPQISDGTFDDIGNESLEFITLQGQTPIQLPDCLNILRAFNASTFEPLVDHQNIAGTVYFFRGGNATNGVPDNLSDIRNIIDNGNNKTQCTCLAIPQGFVGEFEKGEVGLVHESGGFFPSPMGAVAALRVIQRGSEVSIIEKSVPLMSGGLSVYSDKILYPELIPSGGKVSISVEEATDDARFIAEFTVALKHESLFSEKVLAEIGQPGYI